MAESGMGALPPKTVVQAFKEVVARHPEGKALHQKVDGEWCVVVVGSYVIT